ncbi:MBL fold metallo-hydrolase [Hymenobacter terricola]|uniref:MBL fold metallo-hydrolase n=1 Tax=Hymenobacter terricola TaxID=2819236 RepID=UPI001B306513|nr:MBL fold metallo-hydrolase [Hymenobacter terricola]
MNSLANNPDELSRRRFLASAGILTAGIILSPWEVLAQGGSPVTTIIAEAAKSPITIQKLKTGFNVLEGSGGNILVFNGPEGKMMVDAGIDVSKAKIKQALASISPKHVEHLISTHWHFDHASGNNWVHETGANIISQAITKKHLSQSVRVVDWNYTFPPAPAGALPTTLFEKDYAMNMNGETLRLQHYGPAHTDCDIFVHFENADVIHVADTFWNGYYPFIDYSTGGSIKGMLKAAIANVNRVSASTIVVPGHGPVGNKAQLIEFRDMLAAITHNVETLKKQGKSLAETVAAKPTKAFDAKWNNFVIKSDLFTYLVYRGV